MQHIASHYRTIVVGAGPAGVMAAIEASPAGEVLLLDSSPLPRDKSCGGMLNPYAQRFLERYGTLPDAARLEPAEVYFRYVDWDRRIRKPTELRFLNVDRSAFDAWLLGLLPGNVTVVDRAPLRGIEQDGDGVVAIAGANGSAVRYSASHLVGADGARSQVRRAIGVESTATYVTLQDFCELRGDIEPAFDCIYMRDVGDCFAYAYVVPKGDTAIVGSVFYPKTKRPHERHDEVLASLRAAMPELGSSLKREASAALSVRSANDVVSGKGRVLLAGEAGGFMSPTSGEGISYAMNTGRLAGMAIASANGAGALPGYESSVRDIRRNVARKLGWLPFMESRVGKYLAGFVPDTVVSRITMGL